MGAMHVKRTDLLALKVNLQSFVTCVGKFHSVRLRDERNAREKRLIYKEKFFATENGMAKIKGKKRWLYCVNSARRPLSICNISLSSWKY